ncbi:MAG: hypothetical protein M0D53_07625 [Flavobacterium sp. JAD_PAG50586_2]|nr:MAG: hypothetical protein M0D53_07625 [Flavobacterium sp. JAD_PAG50586_2]
MPLENLGKYHFTDAEKQQLDEAVNTILAIVTPKTYNLSPKERTRFGKVGEQKKLLLNAVKEMYDFQPELASPDIDWDEFNADYNTRKYAEMKCLDLQNIAQKFLCIKILHDRDNLADALRDYGYAAYRARFGDTAAYPLKVEKLKQFFPKTGKKKKKE